MSPSPILLTKKKLDILKDDKTYQSDLIHKFEQDIEEKDEEVKESMEEQDENDLSVDFADLVLCK